MAKRKSKASRPAPAKTKPEKSPTNSGFPEILDNPKTIAVFFGGLFLFLILLYKPMVIDGLDVQGSDTVSGIGNTKQLKVYEAEHGERALWNPYMFAGMPIYHRYTGISWSVDNFLLAITDLIDWRVSYLFVGAFGMFLLIKYLGLSTLIAMLSALAFALVPHFQALVVVGHLSKLRAIMWMPYVFIAFSMLLTRRNILSGLLFAASFALMLRTQHYQIVFYTILLLFFTGIWPYLKLAMEKRWSDFLKVNGIFIGAMILVLMIIAQPFLGTNAYTPHSTRGGNAVNINETVAKADKKGAGYDYATNWSYSIPELWNLIVPKFHGGTSQEVYDGDAVPQFKGREIPAYWGDMPLTQSLEYMSVLLILLSLVAILFQWQHPLVKGLALLTLLALALSLGKNSSGLYKLFFYYLPYFDKFRVPMMILTLVGFNVMLLSAIGLRTIFSSMSGNENDGFANPDWKDIKVQRKLYILAGAFFVLLTIPLLVGSGFALSGAGELQRYVGQYGPEQGNQLVDLFKKARLEILQESTLRTLVFFVAGVALLILAVRNIGQKLTLLLGFIVLVTLDLGVTSAGYLKGKFVDIDGLEQRVYRENNVDRSIKADAAKDGELVYRVLPPIRSVLSDSRWQYFHQSIGGYSAAKMQVIQDIATNNLIVPANRQMPYNLNVIGMLNGKYIVTEQQLPPIGLTPIGQDQNARLLVYKNNKALPRAFMVGETRVFEDGPERLKFMNSAEFDPSKIALLEEPLNTEIAAPDSNSYAKVTAFEPDKIVIDVLTNVQTLLVLSEVYYPEWEAHLADGTPLEMYKTNHIIRSMVVPAGQHQITLSFRPAMHYTGITVSWIGWLLVYGGLLFFGFTAFQNRKATAKETD